MGRAGFRIEQVERVRRAFRRDVYSANAKYLRMFSRKASAAYRPEACIERAKQLFKERVRIDRHVDGVDRIPIAY